MSWKIRHIPQPKLSPWKSCGCSPECTSRSRDLEPEPQIGDAWYAEQTGEDWGSLGGVLSRQYEEQHRGKRPPIVVVLPAPSGGCFCLLCLDVAYHGAQPNPERNGWTVTGRLEDGSLTVQPSILVGGIYHGWIRNGVISDDVEGRRYGV